MKKKLAICYPSVNSNSLIDQTLAGCYVPRMATTSRTIRHENFLSLLARYDTNREFADAAGLSAAFVSQIKTGRRNIGDEVARNIERALDLSEGWLDVTHIEINKQSALATPTPILTHISGPRRTIPVISYIQAGEPKEVVDAYAAGDGFETITVEGEVADSLGVHAFALRVNGDSMLPDFRPGDTVVIDPNSPVRPGDIVVAKLERDNAATLKKYRERGVDAKGWPIIELKPLNEDHGPITMDTDNPGKIIGPVVEHRRRLR